MQLTLAAFVKLSVFAIVANTAAVVALPEPVRGLEARQTCLLQECTPGGTNTCCDGTSCSGLSILGLSLPGLCLPSACQVICSKNADCCTNVLNTTFTCELLPGQTIGGCIPQVL